jgi:hypothetical protein
LSFVGVGEYVLIAVFSITNHLNDGETNIKSASVIVP